MQYFINSYSDIDNKSNKMYTFTRTMQLVYINCIRNVSSLSLIIVNRANFSRGGGGGGAAGKTKVLDIVLPYHVSTSVTIKK